MTYFVATAVKTSSKACPSADDKKKGAILYIPAVACFFWSVSCACKPNELGL